MLDATAVPGITFTFDARTLEYTCTIVLGAITHTFKARSRAQANALALAHYTSLATGVRMKRGGTRVPACEQVLASPVHGRAPTHPYA
jgi:hypothetical protein